MRFLGVRVDIEAAHALKQELVQEEKLCLQKVKTETGIHTQIWAARSIAQVFEKLSLPFDRTEKRFLESSNIFKTYWEAARTDKQYLEMKKNFKKNKKNT